MKSVKAAKPVAPVGTDRPLDPYLPTSGNRGYRVSRYELELNYKVASNRLAGRATIIATATDVRGKYALDLVDTMRVSKVSVNGARPAKYTHRDGKLTVTPAQKIPAGAVLTVTVNYSGDAHAPPPLDVGGRSAGRNSRKARSSPASRTVPPPRGSRATTIPDRRRRTGSP